ncbi:MAG: aminopeptidase P family protein [bacterium]|nr:aminopeptidase P family protein [bacterium]
MNIRIKKFSKLLDRNKIKAYLEMDESNKFYITGFKGNPYPLLFVDGQPYFFTPKMLYAQLLEVAPDVVPVIVEESLIKELKKFKIKHKILDLTLSLPALNYGLYKKLDNIFNLKNFYSILAEMRMLKDNSELFKIRKACSITAHIAQQIPEILEEGMTESELTKKINILLIAKAGSQAFDTIVAFGKNTAYPHYIPADVKYKKGESVLVDFGAKYEHYCADMTRTYFAEDSDIFKRVKEVQEKVLEFVKPGKTAGEVDAKTRELFKDKVEYFLHSTGHGVGLDVHEKPMIALQQDIILKKNMVITIEPGLYIQGKSGVRIEDTIVLTSTGCEILK